MPIGIGITCISVFHVVQNHTQHIGGARLSMARRKEFATGLPRSHDDHDSVGQPGQDVAVGNWHDRRTVEHDELVFLPEARQKLPA